MPAPRIVSFARCLCHYAESVVRDSVRCGDSVETLLRSYCASMDHSLFNHVEVEAACRVRTD